MNPEEADLPAARRALEDAIHALAGRRTLPVGDSIAFGPSLLDDLADHIAGAQSATGNRTHPRSTPPIVVDAVDLHHHITTTIRTWVGADIGAAGGLWSLADHTWRPQDTHTIRDYATQILAWATDITNLLDPPRRMTIAAPCPACGTSTIHRPDSGGDIVRQPALQITTLGCTCQHCRTTWGPELYLHLARTLGFNTPPGVLE